MSKQSLLTLGNFNLFRNTNPEIEFSKAKDDRVQAAYSGYDKTKVYDVRCIKQKSNGGVGFIRLSISMLDSGGNREYHNGALFTNDKKTKDNQPDFQGSVNLDNKTDGPKLRLSAWKKKGEKAGDYLSISIQEFQSNDGKAEAGKQEDDAFAMDDAPAKGKSASKPASKPEAKSGAAPANAFDEMDDDIPFAHCGYSSETSKSRRMSRRR